MPSKEINEDEGLRPFFPLKPDKIDESAAGISFSRNHFHQLHQNPIGVDFQHQSRCHAVTILPLLSVQHLRN
uniref:Uncharacterized protein n=1 Tax=Physcomitrium patens TaxID=3218 RepID=A0A2K1L0H2_PHYPA|nr:hypothetical protein PHYPA_002316 [Physcomitrium patens]